MTGSLRMQSMQGPNLTAQNKVRPHPLFAESELCPSARQCPLQAEALSVEGSTSQRENWQTGVSTFTVQSWLPVAAFMTTRQHTHMSELSLRTSVSTMGPSFLH